MLADQPRTYATILRFPDGDVKVSGCHRGSPSRRATPNPKASEIEKQEKAAKRAATTVRDLVKWFQMTYLWTLTYRGPVFDRNKVQQNFTRFLRLVRQSLPDFEAVAVMEFHKGGGINHGGIHLHLAVSKFYPVQVLRSCWWRVVGERMGNVEIEHRGFKDSPKRVGGYIAKYVSKDFDSLPRDFGQHRYLRSRGLQLTKEKLVFFKGHFKEHRQKLFLTCLFSSRSPVITEWLSEDGWQFVFRSYG